MFDSELGVALDTAPGDILTLGTDLGEAPRLGLDFGTRLSLPLLVDSILCIILGTALGNVIVLGYELGESPRLGMSVGMVKKNR